MNENRQSTYVNIEINQMLKLPDKVNSEAASPRYQNQTKTPQKEKKLQTNISHKFRCKIPNKI